MDRGLVLRRRAQHCGQGRRAALRGAAALRASALSERGTAPCSGTGPLVSAVIIFLNAEPFLRDAIDSVFTQTYPHWELVLADDGSSDASTEIALDCARRHPECVRYVTHRGHRTRGMSATRNLAVANAAGTLVAFLDADDVWMPRKLERQVEILEAHPEAALVYGPAQLWYGWTGDPADLERDAVLGAHSGPTDTVVAPPALLPRLLRDECVAPFLSGTLVRRAAIERAGGFEERFRGMFEDQVFYAKVCLEAPVFVSSECLYRYRRHPRSCTSVVENSGQYDSAWRTFLEWLAAYLWRHGVRHSDVCVNPDESARLSRIQCPPDPLLDLWAIVEETLGPYRGPAIYQLATLARRLRAMLRNRLPAPVRTWIRVRRDAIRCRLVSPTRRAGRPEA
jgi:glycosyltransferase involved in cell wall biosynthesis